MTYPLSPVIRQVFLYKNWKTHPYISSYSPDFKLSPTVVPTGSERSMSLQRCTLPLATSTQGVFKLASTLPLAVFHLPRNFNTYKHYRNASSKRQLQTATAYRPYALESVPPPPRNAGIPDTSIAGTVPEINDTRPPRLTGEQNAPPPSGQAERQSVSVTEEEAQKTKPVPEGSTQTQSTSKSTEKPKRSKLRARKAAMTLTATAIEQLRNLLSQPEPKMIRVGVKNRGCSGLAYHLEYVEKAGMFDDTVEQDGVKVLIDSKALFSIIGSEMDWVEDKLNQRFVFRNPNISRCHTSTKYMTRVLTAVPEEQCGCGESFMV